MVLFPRDYKQTTISTEKIGAHLGAARGEALVLPHVQESTHRVSLIRAARVEKITDESEDKNVPVDSIRQADNAELESISAATGVVFHENI